LARGFSIVTDSRGKIVRDGKSLEPTDKITVHLHRGRLDATVTSVVKDDGIHPLAGNAVPE
jgi:exonuclease VII large subunit